MNLINNVSIKTKVTVAFIAVLLITLALGLFSIERLGAVNAAAAEVRDVWLPSTRSLGRFAKLAERYRLVESKYVAATTDEERADDMGWLRQTLDLAEQARASYEPLIAPGQERQLADRLDDAWQNYLAQSRAMLELVRENQNDKATELFRNGLFRNFDRFRNAMKADIVYNDSQSAEMAGRSAALYRETRTDVVAAIVAAFLLCACAGILIIRSLSRPVLRMAADMSRLANGDMTTEIGGIDRRDEIGCMAAAVQVFKERMIEADRLAAEQVRLHVEQAAEKERRRQDEERIHAAHEASLRAHIVELEQTRERLEEKGRELMALALDLAEQKDRVEQASRAKSIFLANMSHELRTPLNAIIGFSELISTELLGPISNRRYVEYSRDIHNSGRHLLALISDILDFSKAEAGKLSLSEEPVDIPSLIGSCARMLLPSADLGQVSLVLVPAPNALVLRADERRLKQIVLNLLSNAIKFTPAGGRVTISAGVTERGDLQISVADTGIGIAEADQERVIQPFAQVDNELNRKADGTGLGLPLTKRLVDLHDGTLTLVSAPNEGTEVAVVFPRYRVIVDAASVEPEFAATEQSRTAL